MRELFGRRCLLLRRCKLDRKKTERKSEMAYKKPEIVAKSAIQRSYVAGCPANKPTHTRKLINGRMIDNGCARCEMSGS